MKPRFDASELSKTKPTQYIVRFAFGAVVTALTGLVAHFCGPGIGGLFLAFPAVLPASLTFVNDEDGRRAAAQDARGSRFGALGLSAFAVVVWCAPISWPTALVLSAAFVAWIIVSLVAYAVTTFRDRE